MSDIRKKRQPANISWLRPNNEQQLKWAANYLRKKNYIPNTPMLGSWFAHPTRYVTEFINTIKKKEKVFSNVENEIVLKKMFNAWEKHCERSNKKKSTSYISEMVSLSHKMNFDSFRYRERLTVKQALEFLIDLNIEHQKIISIRCEQDEINNRLCAELDAKSREIKELQEQIKNLKKEQQENNINVINH
ncbi:hypothetical protein ACXJY6_06770 [Vibrio sp. RC27]